MSLPIENGIFGTLTAKSDISAPSTETYHSRDETTRLDSEVIIPWRDGLQLGDGIDAVTGGTMGSALVPRSQSNNGSAREVKESLSTSILDEQHLHSLRNEYSMELFATINASIPGELGSKAKLLFSQESSLSKIFVQYLIEGRFPVERLEGPELKEGLQNLPSKDFREKYGDYYIAGIQRGYTCRVIVACLVKEAVTRESAEVDAKAMVENFFGAAAGGAKRTMKSNTCSLLNATVELWGYPSGEIQFVGRSLGEAFNVLKDLKSRGPPLGWPRSVLLHHYSCLDHCKLSRLIDVSHKIFNDLHDMRKICSQLQVDLLHPALSALVTQQVQEATHIFDTKRRTLITETGQASDEFAPVYGQLKEAKEDVDVSIRRYNLIRDVHRMDRSVQRFGPGTDKRYKWQCGHLGQSLGKKYNGWNVVRLQSGDEVYEVDWYTPMTRRMSVFETLLSVLFPVSPSSTQSEKSQYRSRRESDPRSRTTNVKLWGETNSSPMNQPQSLMPPKEEPAKAPPKRSQSSHGTEDKQSPEGFSTRLKGVKVLILGWSLSCDWDSETVPKVKVEKGGCILQDRFTVGLDTSVSASWHCRVTFVPYEPQFTGLRRG